MRKPKTVEEAQTLREQILDELEGLWGRTAQNREREHGGHYGPCLQCEEQWTYLLGVSGVNALDQFIAEGGR